MARTILLRLIDMRDAINGIEGVVADREFEIFADNWGMQRAVTGYGDRPPDRRGGASGEKGKR